MNPRHPDFKKKDGSEALWLNKAPNEILSDLENLKFDVPVRSKYAKQPKGKDVVLLLMKLKFVFLLFIN